jgi:hypothetical protein
MDKVAEFFTSKGIIAKVLDDGATVGIGMGLAELVVGESGIALEQEGLDLICPKQVHDFFVSQNRVGGQNAAAQEHREKEHSRADRNQAPTFDYGA